MNRHRVEVEVSAVEVHLALLAAFILIHDTEWPIVQAGAAVVNAVLEAARFADHAGKVKLRCVAGRRGGGRGGGGASGEPESTDRTPNPTYERVVTDIS
jgi:hypothetical protein